MGLGKFVVIIGEVDFRQSSCLQSLQGREALCITFPPKRFFFFEFKPQITNYLLQGVDPVKLLMTTNCVIHYFAKSQKSSESPSERLHEKM